MMRQAAPEFADVQAFRFHAHIHASDGEAGRLVALIVDEQRQAITHLGISVSRFHRCRWCGGVTQVMNEVRVTPRGDVVHVLAGVTTEGELVPGGT
jgi:hypothetical protein